jgi:DNA (cytosine-5)-methyltransferase 1
MGGAITLEKVKVFSLFSGCGGMDLGLEGGFQYLNQNYQNHPFEIISAIDNNSYAVSIYRDNFKHHIIEGDIRELDSNAILDHDLLVGGFPCQSFSISAQNPPRLGYSDDNGQLFFEMVKILRWKMPKIFVAENVKGLLSANKRKAFPLVVREFEKAGYNVVHKLLNSSHYGIPQKRERVFIVGIRKDLDHTAYKFPEAVTQMGELIPLKEVLDEKADSDPKWFFSKRAVDGMLRVKHKMNKGRAQDINNPCNTISSHLSKVSLNSTDPVLKIKGKYRRFTPREAARIQSFPESFNFESVSDGRKYHAIGNAVPPVMMWHVANSLIDFINEMKKKK